VTWLHAHQIDVKVLCVRAMPYWILYGELMRSAVAHLLIAVLIAFFAIGVPLSAQADCATCDECSVAVPAKGGGPCSQKGFACQMAQTCASQLQKVPAQTEFQLVVEASEAAFFQSSLAAVKLAQLTPETAPPRA